MVKKSSKSPVSGKKKSTNSVSKTKKTTSKQKKESKVKVRVDSTDDYDKEMKRLSKKPFFNFEMHPFVIGSLIILLILFVTAAIISFISFNSTVDAILVVKNDSGNSDTIIIKDPSTKIADEINKDQRETCSNIDFNVVCESEYPGNPCTYINDNNVSSQWLAAASCTSGNKPCAVLNYVTVSSENNFSKIKLNNRLEKDYYINRISLSYNNISNDYRFGGKNYTKDPWVIELKEPSSAVEIKIVEIVGVGRNYLAGISEIDLYSKECMKP